MRISEKMKTENYTGGRGESVIDYVIKEERTWDEVKALIVKDKVDSDHHPVVL